MGEIGLPELLIVLAIVIILFGPARLAGVGQSLGQAIRSFRHEIRDEVAKPAADEQKQ